MPKEINILVVGNSHTWAILSALKELPYINCQHLFIPAARQLSKDLSVNFVGLLNGMIVEKLNNISYEGIKTNLFKKFSINSKQKQAIYVLFMLDGNMHNIFGATYFDVEYGTILENNDSEFNQNKYFIPKKCIKNSFLKTFKNYSILDVFLKIFENKNLIMLSPPPPGEDMHIISNKAGFGLKETDTILISSPDYRYKLWKIYIEMFEEIAMRKNIMFVPTPDTLLYKDKYLYPEHQGDATHANLLYGRGYIKHVLKTIGM